MNFLHIGGGAGDLDPTTNYRDGFSEFVKTHKSKKSNKNLIWLIVIAPCILLAFSMLNSKNDYQFCFYDSIKNEPIGSVILNIKILKDGQSPIHKTTDSLGCFNYVTKDKELKFIVESPYYKTDTIVRQFNSEKNKIVKLFCS